jgi:hypothetical protein
LLVGENFNVATQAKPVLIPQAGAKNRRERKKHQKYEQKSRANPYQ